jgi:hypothetical protein
MDCDELCDVAAELAAGTLTGEDRAAALAHMADCQSCWQEVAELAGVVDRVLLLAPPAEPPVGFEARVVAAVTGTRRWGRRRPWSVAAVGLAAAALLLVVGLAVGAFVGRHSAGSNRPAPVLATLTARDGADVGRAVLAAGKPGWVLLDVTGLGSSGAPGSPAASEPYLVELDLGHGRLVQSGAIRLVGGRGSIRLSLGGVAHGGDVVGVRLVTPSGDQECEARFT